MDQPLKVLCELGGWRTAPTVLQCYQRPDKERLKKALVERRVNSSPDWRESIGGNRARKSRNCNRDKQNRSRDHLSLCQLELTSFGRAGFDPAGAYSRPSRPRKVAGFTIEIPLNADI